MFQSISRRLHSWARVWRILALFAAFVLYIMITFPALQAAPGGSIVSLDAQLFYTPDQAYATVGSYAEAAGFWMLMYLTWDVVTPLLYSLGFGLLISWLYQRTFDPHSKWQRLNLVPIGAGLFDLLENLSIVILLWAYPSQLSAVAWVATFFTMSKMSLLLASVLLAIIGLIAYGMKRIRRQ